MSTATLSRQPAAAREAPSLFVESLDCEPMLEELLAGAWEGLAIRGSAPCPVCAADMKARYGAQARPIDGRCSRCGSTLA
jgi:hypothetical protein